jgi:hypothetical protein
MNGFHGIHHIYGIDHGVIFILNDIDIEYYNDWSIIHQ